MSDCESCYGHGYTNHLVGYAYDGPIIDEKPCELCDAKPVEINLSEIPF